MPYKPPFEFVGVRLGERLKKASIVAIKHFQLLATTYTPLGCGPYSGDH
jgi:hypothetical protein